MYFIRSRYRQIFGIIISIAAPTVHAWHDHKSIEQFQAHLYNNDTIKSLDSNKNLEEIRQLKNSLAQVSVFKSEIGYEDVAVFIGTTKSGKSTLINYLLGNELIGTKDRFRSVFIEKVDGSPGPEIGKELASETSIPTKWKSSKLFTNLALWDSPGFEDNRGPAQDISNAFYIKELFKNVQSAKIVIVSDINDILNDRINSFMSLLNSIEHIFNEEFKDCFSNIVLVFTKVPSDFDGEPLTVDFVGDLLKHKISASTSIKISKVGKQFLEYISLNTNQIAFFKKATIGPIDNSVNKGIIKAIATVEGIKHDNLIKVSPSIAPASKVFLFEIRHDLTSTSAFGELNEVVIGVFKNILNEITEQINVNKDPSYLKTIEEDLLVLQNKIKFIIEAKISFHEKIDFLKTVYPDFQDKINKEDLVEKSRIKEFIDELLKLKESDIFNVNLRSIMQNVSAEISNKIVEVKLLLKEMNMIEAEIELQKIKDQAHADIQRAKQEYEVLIRENNKARGFFGSIGAAIDNVLENIIKTFISDL